MINLFYDLPNNLQKHIYIYNFDDNEHKKRLYDDVLNELNKNRIITFIGYNIFIDNKYFVMKAKPQECV